MNIKKSIVLLLLCFFLQKITLCTNNKTLYDMIVQNKVNLAKKLLDSETPPAQEVIDESLVYASGCITIIKNESHNLWGLEQAEMIKALLEHGANPNYISLHVCNRTPLQMASSKGRLTTVQILLAHGADVHMGTEKRQDALTVACNHGHTAIVNELLQRGAVVSEQHAELNISERQVALSHHRANTTLDLLRNPIDLPDDLIQLILTFDGTDSLWLQIKPPTQAQ